MGTKKLFVPEEVTVLKANKSESKPLPEDGEGDTDK